MKKIRTGCRYVLWLLAIAGSLSGTSCRHPAGPGPDFGQGTGRCRLATVNHPSAPQWGSAQLFYNDKGQLARVVRSAGGNALTLFSYHDSSTLVSWATDALGKQIIGDSIVTNARGLISYEANGQKPNFNYERIFVYDDQNQLTQSFVKQFGVVVQTDYYTWNNGNMVRDSFGVGKTLDFSYIGAGFQYSSQEALSDFLRMGIPVWKSRQLPANFAASTVPGVVQHTYTFDEDGKVLSDSLFNTSSQSGYVTTFNYDCR